MTKIDIFSGFLGAGKTTLIKKLIKEAYAGEKLVLIENEFGEIGIDGGFLQDAGVLKFGDFTATSGRKIPYFINAGQIKTGDEIAKLGEFYAKAYFEKVGNKKTVLYGPAYKGISIAVSAAVALSKNGLDVPFFFNRKEEKDKAFRRLHQKKQNQKVLL